MHHAPCTMHHAPCTMHHASPAPTHACTHLHEAHSDAPQAGQRLHQRLHGDARQRLELRSSSSTRVQQTAAWRHMVRSRRRSRREKGAGAGARRVDRRPGAGARRGGIRPVAGRAGGRGPARLCLTAASLSHPTPHTPHPAPAPALGAHTRPCLAPHTPPHQPAPTWMLAMSTGRSIVLPPTLSTAVTRSDMSPPQNAGVCTRGPAQERGWGVLGSSLGCG